MGVGVCFKVVVQGHGVKSKVAKTFNKMPRISVPHMKLRFPYKLLHILINQYSSPEEVPVAISAITVSSTSS
jgi:hypothetical protein